MVANSAPYFITGVYLSLRNKLIPNNSYAIMNDIGSTDDTALVCITNVRSPSVFGGDWFAPNGERVGGGKGPSEVPGIVRTRGRHVVRLKRSSDGTPTEGTYKCVVRDTTDINQTVYVGIYSGICTTCLVLHSLFMQLYFSPQQFCIHFLLHGDWKLCNFQ